MEAAVLFAGLSVYLVATLIYLRGAYRIGSLWCWSSIVLPPVALVFYVIHWRRSWQLFTLHSAGLALLVIGVVLFARSHPSTFEASQWVELQNTLAPASLARPLDDAAHEFADHRDVRPYIGRIDGLVGGRLHQQGFHINEVLLNGGVLRFKKGQGLFPQKEIAIFLGITEFDIDGTWELSINPTTDRPPIIHASTYDVRTGELNTQVFDGGYWLELTLGDYRLNQLSGFVKLMLPGENKDFLAGNFESYTNELRYSTGSVDRFYDSRDTVEYVANMHLETRFKKVVKGVKFLETNMIAKVAHPAASVISELTLVDNTTHTISLNLFKGQQGWTVDADSTDDLQVAINTLVSLPPAAGKPKVVSTHHIYDGKDFDQLIGKKLQVTSKSGSVRLGRLKMVENTQLVLHQAIGQGFMDIHVPKRQVDEVVVLN